MGGRWVQGYWAANACLLELPEARVHEVERLPRVRRLAPNEARGPASLDWVGSAAPTPGPIRESRQGWCHGIDFAHLQTPGADATRLKGKGITIGFFDTGLDANDGGSAVPPYHSAFASPSPGPSRLIGNRAVPGSMIVDCGGPPLTLFAIDCNSSGVHPFHYVLNSSTPNTHADARHGTGMASVALGYQVQDTQPGLFVDGHAPDAQAIGWSICRGTALGSQSCVRWLTDAAAYLAAIQMVMDESAEVGRLVHILNASYDGFPDAADAVNEAFDDLAETFDVLIVTAAGNSTDSTWVSHGLHNGLSVGAVKKYAGSTGPAPRVIANFSARGPLESDLERFFPDVCAFGEFVDTAHVDNFTTAPPGFTAPGIRTYNASGTSVAAPQVAGAAAAYMSRRAASPPEATALETRAALLVNVDDPHRALLTPNFGPADTYTNRNAYGVGFVRHDFLATYAERFGSAASGYVTVNGQTLARSQELVTLTTANPVQTRSWALGNKAEHVVAIAWNRPYGQSLSNVDLEVWSTGSPQVLLAQSRSLKNSYERLAFKILQDNVTVEIRVIGRSLTSATLPVHIAARQHPEFAANLTINHRKVASTGVIEEIPQPSCHPTFPNQVADWVVPRGYAHADGRSKAWGSAPFAFDPPTSTSIGIPKGSTHYIYGTAAMGSDQFTANGINLRLWRPLINPSPPGSTLTGPSITLELLGLAHTTSTTPSTPDVGAGTDFASVYPSGVSVVQGRTVNIVHPPLTLLHPSTPGGAADWVVPQSQRHDTWPIRIPFDQLFTYDPTLGNLALWWRGTWLGGAPNILVDSLEDDDSTPCWVMHIGLAQARQGRCPMLGFSRNSAGTSNLMQSPRLHAMGEPALGEWLWLWTTGFGGPVLGGSPLPGNYYLGVGTANPSASLGTCVQLLTNANVAALPLTMDAAGSNAHFRLFIPDVPALLHSDLFVQVLREHTSGTPPQSSWWASSGLHFKIGGRLQ